MEEHIDLDGLGPLGHAAGSTSAAAPSQSSAGAPPAAPSAPSHAPAAPGASEDPLPLPAGAEDDDDCEARPKLSFGWRTQESIAYARARRSIQIASRKEEERKKELEFEKKRISMISNMIPGAARLLGKKSAKQVGRARGPLQPGDFTFLNRGAFASAKTQVNLGVSHKRLVAAAAKALQERQLKALNRFLTRSEQVLAEATMGDDGMPSSRVHASYVHMWDETGVKFKAERNPRFKSLGMQVVQHVIAQRGFLRVEMKDELAGTNERFSETWVCQPKAIDSTKAEALLPAIEDLMPPPFKCDFTSMNALAPRLTSYSFMPVTDRASSNLGILRRFGTLLEEAAQQGKAANVLYLPDICMVHGHVRAKLNMTGMKAHMNRHFAISKLYRLQAIQTRMLKNIELIITKRVQRKLEAPPPTVVGLRRFIDIVFDLSSDIHRRGKMGRSTRSSTMI